MDSRVPPRGERGLLPPNRGQEAASRGCVVFGRLVVAFGHFGVSFGHVLTLSSRRDAFIEKTGQMSCSTGHGERVTLVGATVLLRCYYVRCCCGATAVLLRCCCGAAAVLLRCCCGAAAVLLRCCCGAAAVLLRCCCGAAAVLLRCYRATVLGGHFGNICKGAPYVRNLTWAR